MNPLFTYLKKISGIRSSNAGVKETSYLGPPPNLLNEIGNNLKLKVKRIISLTNRGAGLPDGGLFASNRFQKLAKAEPLSGTILAAESSG